MAGSKRERPSARGFSPSQERHLKDGVSAILEKLQESTNPADLMQLLKYILAHPDAKRLASFLEHERYAAQRVFCQQITLLHSLYHTPKQSALFKSLPDIDDLDELTDKHIKTFQITLKDKIDLEIWNVSKAANTDLTPEQNDYFRKYAIKPACNTIAEFNVNDLAFAISVLELILKEQNNDDFFEQLADQLAKAFGGDNASAFTHIVKEKCKSFWHDNESDVPTQQFTQKMHDMCNAICSLAMLIKSPQKNKYVSMCPLKNPDNSSLSKEQLSKLRELVKNEIKLFIDGLKDPKVMPNKKWQHHKEEFKKLKTEKEHWQVEAEKLQAENKTLLSQLTESKHELDPTPKKRPKPAPVLATEPESSESDISESQLLDDSASFEFSDSSENEGPSAPKRPLVVKENPPSESESASIQFAEECIMNLLSHN